MYKLRDYQQAAVDKTISYFKKKRDPAVIVLPTGAGKSLVIAEMARIAKGRVLVLAHVKELVEQNHQKYESYGLEAGVYSAGLNKKQSTQKVIFGSIQSVARATDELFQDFTLLIIDECHRVSLEVESQYSLVISKLRKNNENICILGLTATPYRLGLGWIYNESSSGVIRTTEERFFKRCVFELPLQYMIKNKFLTPPVKINIPVTCYDFSELTQKNRMYSASEIEEVISKQRRLTPLIIKNIIDITNTHNRKGVMIFCGSIAHAEEVLSFLPDGDARLVVGDTEDFVRDEVIEDFKQKKFKYLVNVSVLTTGFDAPHVDVIAILRPTESVSLYQQIIGRGLRIDKGKEDCFILDYTGIGHDIFSPEVEEKKVSSDSVIVEIECPECGFENHFWGLVNDDGEVIEHYGRKCRGAVEDPESLEMKKCGYRFRFKICNQCGEQNDLTARACQACHHVLIDVDSKLKQARLSKDSVVLKPDRVEFSKRYDKNQKPFLEVKYFDFDANYLAEYHYLNYETDKKKFSVNFLRSHIRRPELTAAFDNIDHVITYQKLLRSPMYVIARKQDKFWKITEKIFIEEL